MGGSLRRLEIAVNHSGDVQLRNIAGLCRLDYLRETTFPQNVLITPHLVEKTRHILDHLVPYCEALD
jgi:hypothetical protein